MKKQIVIVTRRMITGGVERALIAMLKQFDYNEVDVDLYVELEDGELYEEIPKNIQVHLLPTVHGKNAMVHPYSTIKKLMSKMKLKTKMPYLEQNLYYSKMLLPLKKRYDIAIAYHAPNTVPVFYVINQIKAKKKILWLHGDMETNAGDEMLAIKYHSCFDQVFAVSKSVYDSFLKYHPHSYMLRYILFLVKAITDISCYSLHDIRMHSEALLSQCQYRPFLLFPHAYFQARKFPPCSKMLLLQSVFPQARGYVL